MQSENLSRLINEKIQNLSKDFSSHLRVTNKISIYRQFSLLLTNFRDEKVETEVHFYFFLAFMLVLLSRSQSSAFFRTPSLNRFLV